MVVPKRCPHCNEPMSGLDAFKDRKGKYYCFRCYNLVTSENKERVV